MTGNGHAPELLTKLLRVDGSSPLVRVETDEIIRAAADKCTVPIDRHDADNGLWTFVRGQRVPGRDAVFGRATCTRCPAERDAVIPANGRPLGGPVFYPVRQP